MCPKKYVLRLFNNQFFENSQTTDYIENQETDNPQCPIQIKAMASKADMKLKQVGHIENRKERLWFVIVF